MAALSRRIRKITKQYVKKGIGTVVVGISGYLMTKHVGLPQPIEFSLFKATIHSDKQGNEGKGKDESKKGETIVNGSPVYVSNDIILNLEEVVRRRAHFYFKVHQRSIFKRKPVIEVHWSEVTFCPERPDYIKLVDEESVLSVPSEIYLKNNSSIVQQHKLKTDIQTVSLCNSSLIQGYTKGTTIGLSLPVPRECSEISRNFTLNLVERNTDKESSTSVVEDYIKVPGNSTITVLKLTNRKEKRFSFSTWIKVEGHVKAIIYDQKKNIIGYYYEPMATIIDEEFPRSMTSQRNSSILIRGECNFIQIVDNRIVTQSPERLNRTHESKNKESTKIVYIIPIILMVATLYICAK